MLAARAARTSMRVPFLRHVAPAISHANVAGRTASARSVGAAVHNASVRMMSSASGTTSTVRAATSNYRRRRAIPPPPPGRPPYPRPSPTMVGLWVGGAAVATFASYKIFDMFADTPASDQAQEATKFTGTLQPQAGPVNGYTKCGAAVLVTLPATDADLPSAARKLVETQEKIAAETEQLAAHVTIGFSPAAWAELSPHEAKGCADFALTARSGPHGGLPATGGDILLHVQADSAAAVAAAVGQLTSQLPEGATVNTTYGEDYLGGRDLSGFPVGITAPATPAAREDAAVEPATGGSYVLAQRWAHNMAALGSAPPGIVDDAMGRRRSDGSQLGSVPARKANGGANIAAAVANGLPASSHVARMTSSMADGSQVEVVRYGLPYVDGDAGAKGETGTYILGYSSHPAKLFHLLDRMVGVGGVEGAVDVDTYTVPPTDTPVTLADRLMTFSACKSGQVFYAPSVVQLRALRAEAKPSPEQPAEQAK